MWRYSHPKYLGVLLDNKLDKISNTDLLYGKDQTKVYFLKMLASFNICTKLLKASVLPGLVAIVLLYAVMSWGDCTSKRNIGQLNQLIKKAGSVVGLELPPVEAEVDQRTLSRV